MKPKNFVPLIVILAILAVLVVAKKAKEQTPGIVEQVGLVALLPEGLSKGDLAKIEMYVGAKPEDKVVLAWDAGASKWRATSEFNAPVTQTKIDEYLDAITKLQGEPRSVAGSTADLEPYNLTEEKAFHLLGYKKDAEAAAFHLLVGAAPGYKTIFIRKADDMNVFVEATNLRQLAGLYGDETDKAPEADVWLDKQILDLDKEKINKVTLTGPDKELVFELQAKPGEPAKDEAAESAEESAEEATEEAAEPSEEQKEPEVEYEWVLAKGGPGGPHKQAGLDSLLRKFDSLTANGVVDPSKKAEWGLEPPAFKCVVAFKDETPEVVIEGGRPDASGDGYVRVATNPEDIVYKLSKYNFGQLWPKGADLFDLPKLNVDKASIEQVALTQPDGNAELVKKDDVWTVAAPSADLKPLNTTLDTIARTLAAWKAEDYADSSADCGLDTTTRRITFSTKSGESHTITLGADSKYIDGVYARLDSGDAVLAMNRTELDKICIAPNDLFDRALFAFAEEDITSVQVRGGDGIYLVERQDDGTWNLVIEGTSCEADPAASEALFAALTDLEAKEILFGKAVIDGEVFATVSLTRKGGGTETITIGAEQDGAYPVAVQGKKQVFTIASADGKAITPSADSLKKPEPEPAPLPEAAEAASAEAPLEPAEGSEPISVTVVEPGATEQTPEPGAVPAEMTVVEPPVEPAPAVQTPLPSGQ